MIARSRPLEVAAEPLYLIGVDVGGGHLDGGRKIEDRLPLERRLPDIEHGLADFDRIVQLSPGEALGRILEANVGVGQRLDPAQAPLGAVDGDLLHALAVGTKDDAAL